MGIKLEGTTSIDRFDAASAPKNGATHFRKPALPLRMFYRLRQFLRGIVAHVTPDEMLVVASILPKPALARFCQMPLDAQRHSLNVLYTLQDAGYDQPDLAAAALLHDVGKVAGDAAGIRLGPWLRGPLVLAAALAPEHFTRLAVDDSKAGWRYLLYVHLEHPRIGAGWAAEDQCSPLTCWLIERHQDELANPPHTLDERLLALLQWADNCN